VGKVGYFSLLFEGVGVAGNLLFGVYFAIARNNLLSNRTFGVIRVGERKVIRSYCYRKLFSG
jgi:hypothetical protein